MGREMTAADVDGDVAEPHSGRRGNPEGRVYLSNRKTILGVIRYVKEGFFL